MKTNNNYCKLCNEKISSTIYIPKSTFKDASIHICPNCLLVQSIFNNNNTKKIASLSSDANWGNVRHGKKLRLENQKKLLNFEKLLKGNILDIGSNRGDFIKFASSFKSVKKIYAIEPDKNIINYKSDNLVSVINSRIENINLDKNIKFNFIYCSHTLEHLDEFKNLFLFFDKHLSVDGKILIDLPDLEYISNKRNVEEFFIDKHTFHFSVDSVKNTFKYYGYKIDLEKIELNNLLYIIKKNKGSLQRNFQPDINKLKYYKELISSYKLQLEINRNKLIGIVQEIQPLINSSKTAIWGSGRILDSLVKYGNLKLNRNTLLVDNFISGLPNDVNQQTYQGKIFTSEEIKKFEPEFIFVFANSAEDEIMMYLEDSYKGVVISWTNLIK